MEATLKFRRTLLFVLMFFSPLTFIYFSPVIIQMATWDHTFALVHISFAVLFISTIFLGRAWCSYACPFGAFQDVMAKVIPLRQTDNKLFKNLRQIMGIIWLAALLYPIIIFGFNKTDILLSADSKNEPANMLLIMYLIIFGIFGLITFFSGKRALCKYLCPSAALFRIGMFLKKRLPFATLKLLAIKEKCSSCGACNKVCPMNLDIQDFVQNGKFNEEACILCGECVAGCPKGVLKRGFRK